MSRNQQQSRREFLKTTAAAAAAASGLTLPGISAESNPSVAIFPDPDDKLTSEPPVQWAIEQLRDAFSSRGITAQVVSPKNQASAAERIVIGSRSSALARERLARQKIAVPDFPEALALVRSKGQAELLACGSDVRGLVYGVLELADRVRFAQNPLKDLRAIDSIIQRPANKIRSIARPFNSDVEDKPWFYDRSFWESYLTELATQRFNRFSLTFGIGYDFTTDITDAYFHFAYPFLLSVPGYDVRAVPLPDAERDKNLEMLKYIGNETVKRGLQFHLGLWTHAYKWTNSPHANYVIEGLNTDNHAAYCRDALTALLKAVPTINGVTLRIHGESGIAEGSYDFWKTLFDAVPRCGRRVEIDLHAKGIDQQMIDNALATGMPVTVAPKFWAEHMGLGYMQGAIRPLEMPPREENDKGFFSKSNGSRRFLRYGYGDLLAENRRYGVLHRIWPGTQRLLLWGDPELASQYGRASSFCDSSGVEWFEPLSFKGRKGSGWADFWAEAAKPSTSSTRQVTTGERTAYADRSLEPGYDFRKFLYSYRVWGRHIYDPVCDPDEYQRLLRAQFGSAGQSMEKALGSASKILPLITTAHCPSAANNNYWPEMYYNMPIVDPKRRHPYGDTLSPKRFGAVSPLDPEFFLRIEDFAELLLKGEASAKISPTWVATQLESLAFAARKSLVNSQSKLKDLGFAEFRRAAADISIQSGLGLFFAAKFRAATLFTLYDRSKHIPALERALALYRKARAAWADFATKAQAIYRSDVTFGPEYFQRGHWLDRLAAIDGDLADMEKLLKSEGPSKSSLAAKEKETVERAMKAVLSEAIPAQAQFPADAHVPIASFHRGQPVLIKFEHRGNPKPTAIQLHFRRVNQGEPWQSTAMSLMKDTFRGQIPGRYADSPFPIQYYFEMRPRSGEPFLYPGLGLNSTLYTQPYFIVRQT
jgi:hypothetical protein